MAMHADLDRKTRQFGKPVCAAGPASCSPSRTSRRRSAVSKRRVSGLNSWGQRIREEMERFVSPAWRGHLG